MPTPVDLLAEKHGLERVGGTIDAALRQICAELGVAIPEDANAPTSSRPSPTGCLKGSRGAAGAARAIAPRGKAAAKPAKASATSPRAAARSSPRAAASRMPPKTAVGRASTKNARSATDLERVAAARSVGRPSPVGKRRGVAFGENSVREIPARGD